jgi:hypothetical protein
MRRTLRITRLVLAALLTFAVVGVVIFKFTDPSDSWMAVCDIWPECDWQKILA